MSQQLDGDEDWFPWISPSGPLSEGEVELLSQLEAEGTHVAGLVLERREDGRVFVRSFAPPQALASADQQPGNRRTRLTSLQLGRGAESLYARGEYRLASASFMLCSRLNALSLGPEHPRTLTSANDLATTLRAQGHLAGARRIHESVFETR